MPEEEKTSQTLPERLGIQPDQIPAETGVYLMKDVNGRILYIGKANHLRKRFQAYCKRPEQLPTKTAALLRNIASVETIVTGNEKEALLLESNLIKRHRPRYNVVLKDDKRYPSLRLNWMHPFPNLGIVRKAAKDGAQYFGPYSSAHAVRQSLKFIDKTFKLRKCKDSEFNRRTRPCLHHQMGTCWGPCSLKVDPERYREVVKEVVLFLSGRTPELIRRVRRRMQEAAKRQDFETAARLRDKMFALEKTLERQTAVTSDFRDRDVIGLACGADRCLATLLRVRGGYLLGVRDFELPRSFSTDEELVESFVRQYYDTAPSIPPEILVPHSVENRPILEEWLRTMAGRRVLLHHPRRGGKVKTLQLAVRNAKQRLVEKEASDARRKELLERVGKRLKTRRRIERIECFDNSHILGTSAVSAMVVFQRGEPLPSAYRKYRLDTEGIPDDYAAMQQVLQRRYGKGKESEPLPDLLLLDGGKGQLNIAMAVLKELGMEERFDVAAIAKKDEKKGETRDKVFLPMRSNPVSFGRDEDLLLFLQRIRDEAHRFVIGYHRKRRAAVTLRSVLDNIPGIGPRRKRALIRRFGSVEKVAVASMEDLCALPEMNRAAAAALRSVLAQGEDGTKPAAVRSDEEYPGNEV